MEKFCKAKKIGDNIFELDYYPIIRKGIISYGSNELGTFTFSVCNNWLTLHIDAVAEITPYMFVCIYNLLPEVGKIEVVTL